MGPALSPRCVLSASSVWVIPGQLSHSEKAPPLGQQGGDSWWECGEEVDDMRHIGSRGKNSGPGRGGIMQETS